MEQGSLVIELYPSVTKYSTAKGIHRETGMKRFKEYRKHHNKIVAVIRNNKIWEKKIVGYTDTDELKRFLNIADLLTE